MLDNVLRFLAHGLTYASGWAILVYTLIATHITIAAVTIYLHRCQAHRALDLHPLVSHLFRFWLWLTTGMKTREWAAIHRKHHAKCDSEEDPHSPVTYGIKKVLLQGAELYRLESKNPDTISKYGHGTPDDWLERNVYSRFSWQGVGLMLIVDILLFGVIGLSVWAVQMLWIPVTAAGIVNGIGHYWGYRNYDCADAATNIVPFGILIGGEELHNNHHTYPTSAKLSSKWYEFDIGWMYIRILVALGLAKIKRLAPVPKFDPSKRTVDFSTLHAVIANRYDVMSQYMHSLRRVWHGEAEHLVASLPGGAQHLRDSWALMQQEPGKLAPAQQQKLSEIFACSAVLRTMHEMRLELIAIWSRSNANREQLLKQLQDWCVRAEVSGIKALQEFSFRLRTYVAN